MISIEEKKVFALNRNTTVVIKSRKDKDAEIYRTTVSLIHETADVKPLQLRTTDEVKDYIAGVELDDDQASLFNG